MKQQIKRGLELVFVPIAAAVVFVEQVLIKYLNVAMAAFARLPWVARLEAWLVTLPPYGALATFAAPSILILPVKFSAVWFGYHRHYALAFASVLAGKVIGTAILARLYRILRPNLMTIGWFAWADTHFFYWRDKAYAFVKALPAWKMAAKLADDVRAWLAGLVAGLFAR
ncbi:MAG TPA: hypothetical protein VFB13_07645 [Reyranella sp.]|nr:hypothetical protein [Reyranella sp.]